MLCGETSSTQPEGCAAFGTRHPTGALLNAHIGTIDPETGTTRWNNASFTLPTALRLPELSNPPPVADLGRLSGSHTWRSFPASSRRPAFVTVTSRSRHGHVTVTARHRHGHVRTSHGHELPLQQQSEAEAEPACRGSAICRATRSGRSVV